MKYYYTPTLYNGLGNKAMQMYIGVNDANIITSISSSKPIIENEIIHCKGAIMPCMINAHCHLELSHLHNKIETNTGINKFITALELLKSTDANILQQAATLANTTMANNGIIAVGDISNTTATFDVKDSSTLHYHTFIELYGFSPGRAQQVFANGLALLQQYKGANVSLTPHAPYSVSTELMQLINQHCVASRKRVF
jgi:aminodeoxyfutalosine deaminase